MAAMQWLTRAGQISDEKRRGVHPRLRRARAVDARRPDEPPARPGGDAGDGARARSTSRARRSSASAGTCPTASPAPRSTSTASCATSTASRSPVAVLDVWQADTEGAYESQLPDVDEARLRAKYTTREDGSYCVRTIAPKGYTIPMDGPVGDLISRTEISHFRPAHVHFLINVPGYEPLITHLFQEGARVPGQRRRLRHQAGAGRPVRASGNRARRRTAARRPSRGSRPATTSCCSRQA